MTEPTSTNPKKDRSGRAATQVLDAGPLTPLEEKVLMMRKGKPGPSDLKLSQVGQDRPEIAAQLREIELRALKMSGRLEELQAEVNEPGQTDEATKNKIIDRLKRNS